LVSNQKLLTSDHPAENIDKVATII